MSSAERTVGPPVPLDPPQPPDRSSLPLVFTAPRRGKPPTHWADLTPAELTTLVRNADAHKQSIKSTGEVPLSLRQSLAGRTVAMTFSKRSTRTRVSTEGAISALGASPMFLGKDDIQLGVCAPS